MNQKAYSILFCALLASTFVHEIRAKYADVPSYFIHHVERRAADNQVCTLECDYKHDISVNLNITALEKEEMLIIGNFSVNLVFILDIKISSVAVADGNTGAMVILLPNNRTGVYITPDWKGWNASEISIQDYLVKLKSLSVLFDTHGDSKFEFDSPPAVASKLIKKVIGSLIFNIRAELEASASLAFQILVTITTAKLDLLKGVLKGFLTVVGTDMTTVSYDLVGLLNQLKALATLCDKFEGGLNGLLKIGIVFNIQSLLSAGNGLEVLITFILSVVVKTDIGKTLTETLNDVDSGMKLIAQLGGNGYVGVNGIFKVVSLISGFINGKVQLDEMIDGLVLFLGSNRADEKELTAAFKSTLAMFLAAIIKADATKALAGLSETIRALQIGALMIKDVSISKIITMLISAVSKGGTSLLESLVLTLQELKDIVPLAVSLPMCLLVLMLKINTARDITILRALSVAIDFEKPVSSGTIIATILNGSISNLRRIMTGNMYKVLAAIPNIGKIVSVLNAAVSSATRGLIVLESIVNVSVALRTHITALIQWLLGLPLSVPERDERAIRDIMARVTSIDYYYHISITPLTAVEAANISLL